MPVFRNISPNRQSGRLANQTPVIYDGEGWPTPESINYIPNGGPSDGSISQSPTSSSSSLSSLTFPQFDRSYSHSCQQERRPCVPSDEQYPSSPINTSCLPSPRESHSRRREPGHIPRPRNAFIFFRSSYISGRRSAGDGQQHELSKQAGKVWNRMTEDEKHPFVALANIEKKRHQAMYPNYTYCPGRGAARRKGRTVTKDTSGPKKKTSAMSSSSSFESIFPEIPSTVPAQRPPRAAAQRAIGKFLQSHSISPSPCPVSLTPEESPMLEIFELTYPEPETPAAEHGCVPTTVSKAPKTDASAEDNAFVRTVGIPILELTPTKKELQESEPQFDLTMQPPHLDRIPEQFGFKYHSDSAAMLAYLPPMPNTNNDTAYTGDVPSLFCQPSRLPANPSVVRMTDDDPFVFSSDGNITELWPQSTTHYSEIPRMHVPGFAWSSYENFPHTSMLSEDMWLEEDMTFMGSFFNFGAL